MEKKSYKILKIVVFLLFSCQPLIHAADATPEEAIEGLLALADSSSVLQPVVAASPQAFQFRPSRKEGYPLDAFRKTSTQNLCRDEDFEKLPHLIDTTFTDLGDDDISATCELCEKFYPSILKASFIQHQRKDKTLLEQGGVKCKDCKKIYSQQGIQKHMVNKHSQPCSYKCIPCNLPIKKSGNISRHFESEKHGTKPREIGVYCFICNGYHPKSDTTHEQRCLQAERAKRARIENE